MQRLPYEVRLGFMLVLFSAATYLLHYAIFRDSEYIVKFMLCNIAFLFVQVLIVTIEPIAKLGNFVILANGRFHNYLKILYLGFRRGDGEGVLQLAPSLSIPGLTNANGANALKSSTR